MNNIYHRLLQLVKDLVEYSNTKDMNTSKFSISREVV